MRRMDGVPSKAFGTQGDQGGVDKAQHFFRSAQLAYDLRTGDRQTYGLCRPSIWRTHGAGGRPSLRGG